MSALNETFRTLVMSATLLLCIISWGGCTTPNLTAVQHTVFVLKENRTMDSYFGTFPGVDGTTTGVTSTGMVVPLSHMTDTFQGQGLCNGWDCALTAMDGGKMDRFDLITGGALTAYVQAREQDIPNYWAYAQQFVVADHYFTSVHGPSLPNHFFALAAQAGGAIDNESSSPPGINCDGTPSGTVPVIDQNGNRTQHSPCFDFPSLPQRLQEAGISWEYYSDGSGGDLSLIAPIRNGPGWKYALGTLDQFLAAARTGQLPAVSWVLPPWEESEHPPNNICTGEDWTVELLNAVMEGPEWGSTVVFITYDDFGGLYDHVPPPQVDEFGLGPRVPLLIVSPFAKRGYVSHTVYEHSSILKFIETRYQLQPLSSRDAAASAMLDSFDFSRAQAPLTLEPRPCPAQ